MTFDTLNDQGVGHRTDAKINTRLSSGNLLKKQKNRTIGFFRLRLNLVESAEPADFPELARL